jgi:hypothetical protein
LRAAKELNFVEVKADLASLSADETDGLGAAKEFCVSEPLLEGSDDGSCAFSWETNPTC